MCWQDVEIVRVNQLTQKSYISVPVQVKKSQSRLFSAQIGHFSSGTKNFSHQFFRID